LVSFGHLRPQKLRPSFATSTGHLNLILGMKQFRVVDLVGYSN